MRLSTVPCLPRALAVAALAGLLAPAAGCSVGFEERAGGAAGTAPVRGPGATVSPGAVAPAAANTSVGPAIATTPRAAAVLRRWDVARAAAFASGDPAALGDLYVPGSRAGRRDVRTLRAYLDRGLRVEGMRMQLLAVRVLDERPGRLRLKVTDRLTGAIAVGPRGPVRLPRDTASTRVVDLVRDGGRWRVAEVSGPGPRPSGP